MVLKPPKTQTCARIVRTHPRAQAPLEPEAPPPDPTQLTYAITLTPTLPYPTGTLRRTCASMRHMAASEEAGARAVPSAASG